MKTRLFFMSLLTTGMALVFMITFFIFYSSGKSVVYEYNTAILITEVCLTTLILIFGIKGVKDTIK